MNSWADGFLGGWEIGHGPVPGAGLSMSGVRLVGMSVDDLRNVYTSIGRTRRRT